MHYLTKGRKNNMFCNGINEQQPNLNDIFTDIWDGAKSLVSGSKETLDKSAESIKNTNETVKTVLDEVTTMKKYAKPVIAVVGVTLLTLWTTQIIINVREIRK